MAPRPDLILQNVIRNASDGESQYCLYKEPSVSFRSLPYLTDMLKPPFDLAWVDGALWAKMP